MPKESPISNSSTISSQPGSDDAADVAEKVHGRLDGQGKDKATVVEALDGFDEIFERIAADLYSLASMLVGEGEESIELMETAVATAEVSADSSAEEARHNSQYALAWAAIELIAERNPLSLAAPEKLEHAVTCIEDDDLDAAAEAREAMERMIAGPDRDRVRAWLESLPTALRTIYVLRAVAGFTASETGDLLAARGGPLAAGWSPDQVRELFRQGLCSLASQLIHATAG
jgi:DNA-directed RNA polymerase specialized sigma24 family protein